MFRRITFPAGPGPALWPSEGFAGYVKPKDLLLVSGAGGGWELDLGFGFCTGWVGLPHT